MGSHIEENLDETAPAAAKRLLTDLVNSERIGTPLVETRVTICFDTLKGEEGKSSLEKRLNEVSWAVNRIDQDLAGCGVTHIRLASSTELAGMLRSTYAPNERLAVESALVNGVEDGLTWRACGPVTSEEERNWFRHNDHYTAAFFWAEAPRSRVNSKILSQLCSPGKYPKCVTLSFKPTPAEKAAKQLETQRVMAGAVRILKDKTDFEATARERLDEEAAYNATEAEARGAGHGNWSLIATTTADSLENLDAAIAALKGAGHQSKLDLRPAIGSHGAYLAATLPAGILLSDLAKERFGS